MTPQGNSGASTSTTHPLPLPHSDPPLPTAEALPPPASVNQTQSPPLEEPPPEGDLASQPDLITGFKGLDFPHDAPTVRWKNGIETTLPYVKAVDGTNVVSHF
jgi:hypothetical protein